MIDTPNRKLASVRKVLDIQPIKDADMIEVYTVDGWKVVDKKGAHQVGDLVIYFEIDSFLPERPEFEFLRKSSYIELEGRTGFRLKTIKLRGQVSQGLIMSLSTFPELTDVTLGDDVSDQLNIVKYDPPIPTNLAGLVKGKFPSFLTKTNEERIQNMSNKYDVLSTLTYYITEKLDGSSATFYHCNGVFGVCSRNLELKESEDNAFWRVAKLLDLESKLSKLGNICLQGELVGPGIQKNIYKLDKPTVYFFTAYNINTSSKLSFADFDMLLKSVDLKSVPILSYYTEGLPSIEDLLVSADGKSMINPNTNREGIVLRALDSSVSFKVISNKFLLKQHD